MALPKHFARQAITRWQRVLAQLPALSAVAAQHCASISIAQCDQANDRAQTSLLGPLLSAPVVPGHTQFVRQFSGQATEQQAEAQASWHFPVAVGSKLLVNLPPEAPGISVGVNSDPEAVTVQCRSDSLQLDSQENTIHISAGDELKDLIQVWVPERFCTVEVKGGLGSVSVANINQGDLQVETTGGAVDLGKIRSEHVTVTTRGGPLQAKLLSGSITLDTQGGVLSLGQLMGNQVTVDSGGGDCRIRSVYAESFDLKSDGGKIHIEVLRPEFQGGNIHIETLGSFGLLSAEPAKTSAGLEPNVRIEAGTGDIRVDKLDGAARLRTSGGDVTIQLTEKTELLELHMEGGDLTLSVPPSQSLQGPSSTPSSQQREVVIDCQSSGFKDVLASIIGSWRCGFILNGLPKRIIVKKGRGWMDALQERLSEASRTQ
ncbi:hypothetical protein KFL_000310120 [Klebsormidium nitens]|uniref:DUF4097 domain-containing protein n=1 Tax=Klebsormidium nitens TaxID=105231 RepID=A0A1Y1HR53_KLENI|nr:hypothetical protein KFL_000310120 [Klebsormidium nitens]|eukprot:GAQ79461.1 hypothetical protein KFL_000310120 [Klebsormidium nitens]